MTSPFNPFENRLCRDIRNELSESLPETLRKGDVGPSQRVADNYLKDDLEPHNVMYIKDRLSRYQTVIYQINSRQLDVADTYKTSVLLWNQGLFFEVHEVLEEKWHQSSGKTRKMIQAFIRAAGVYVHLANSRKKSAEKMAGKAVAGLIEHKDMAEKIFNVDLLISSLQSLDAPPPKLTIV